MITDQDSYDYGVTMGKASGYREGHEIGYLKGKLDGFQDAVQALRSLENDARSELISQTKAFK